MHFPDLAVRCCRDSRIRTKEAIKDKAARQEAAHGRGCGTKTNPRTLGRSTETK